MSSTSNFKSKEKERSITQRVTGRINYEFLTELSQNGHLWVSRVIFDFSGKALPSPCHVVGEIRRKL